MQCNTCLRHDASSGSNLHNQQLKCVEMILYLSSEMFECVDIFLALCNCNRVLTRVEFSEADPKARPILLTFKSRVSTDSEMVLINRSYTSASCSSVMVGGAAAALFFLAGSSAPSAATAAVADSSMSAITRMSFLFRRRAVVTRWHTM